MPPRGPGSRPLRAAAFAVALAGAAPASGQEAPFDTLTARSLLEDATEALRESPELLAERPFVEYLDTLRLRWGLPPLGPEFSEPRDVLQVLIDASSWRQAAGHVAALEEPTEQYGSMTRLFLAMVSAGLYQEAIHLADSTLNAASPAAGFVLAHEPLPPEERVAVVLDALERGLVGPMVRAQVLGQALSTLAGIDFEAAWAIADTATVPRVRSHLRQTVLPFAFFQQFPSADSLLRATHEEVIALEVEWERTERLGWLAILCHTYRWEACGELDLPEPGAERDRHTVRESLLDGRPDLAEAALEAMAERASATTVALAAVWALVEAGAACLHHPGCGRELERWTDRWVPRATELAAQAPATVADSLRRFAAALVAPGDPALAFRLVEAVEAAALRQEAWGHVAEVLVEIDVRSAWDAARRGAEDRRGRTAAGRLFPLLLAMGEEDAAAEALGIVEPWDRRNRRIELAERLLRAGRWSEAREWALSTLDDWRPREEASVRSVGAFRIFRSLDIYDELVDRARSLESPEDRAVALVRVVGDVPPLR